MIYQKIRNLLGIDAIFHNVALVPITKSKIMKRQIYMEQKI